MATDLNDMLNGYIDCALWVGVTGPDPDANEPLYDLSADVLGDAERDAIRAECADFLELAGEDAAALGAGQLGHDLFLTRNGHGAGFWDRGLGAAGERLTAWAKSMGSDDWFLADDGSICRG